MHLVDRSPLRDRFRLPRKLLILLSVIAGLLVMHGVSPDAAAQSPAPTVVGAAVALPSAEDPRNLVPSAEEIACALALLGGILVVALLPTVRPVFPVETAPARPSPRRPWRPLPPQLLALSISRT